MHDVVDPCRIDVDVARQPALADAVRPHEFLQQDFTGRDRVESFCLGHRVVLETCWWLAVSRAIGQSSFRDAPLGVGPESITGDRGYGFRVRAKGGAPRNDRLMLAGPLPLLPPTPMPRRAAG